MDEIMGSQGSWLTAKLDHVPADVNFVFVMDHHPPYTSSSDETKLEADTHRGRASSRWRECWRNGRRTHRFE